MKEVDDIKAIRALMERSSKFLSLSGLSGVVAGAVALLGAAFAYFYLLRDPSATDFNRYQEMLILLADAVVVLVLAVGFGIFFSWRKARRSGEKLSRKIALKTLYNLAIPLVAGGIFCLMLLYRGDLRMAIAGTLVFYGLALVNASKFTLEEIHYLGITEIALGLAAAFSSRYGIIFWSLGFGICHIVYGLIMYFKYDRKRDDQPDI